ncbi:hypothetical protein [Streptomyces sp.]|uniref:hypothetical protein n=1 Tax=Streptomyces sp. TaxID=1931 RepID=UPI002F414DF6
MNDNDLPPFVTFETGAALLVQLGIDEHATGDGVRYMARTAPDWPFGPGKAHDYIVVAGARTMETGVFLDFYRTHPRTGRGRDRGPRKRRIGMTPNEGGMK